MTENFFRNTLSDVYFEFLGWSMSNLLMWRGGGIMTHSAAIHQGAIDMFSLSRSPHIVHLYICHWFRSSKAESKCPDFPALVWVLMAAQTHGQQGPSSWLSADFTGLHCFNYPQFIAIGTWRFSSCALQKKNKKNKTTYVCRGTGYSVGLFIGAMHYHDTAHSRAAPHRAISMAVHGFNKGLEQLIKAARPVLPVLWHGIVCFHSGPEGCQNESLMWNEMAQSL